MLWNAGSKSSGNQQVAQQRLRAVTSSAMTLLRRTEVVLVSGYRTILRQGCADFSGTCCKHAWMLCKRTGAQSQLCSFRSLRAVTTEPAIATTSQKSWQGRYLSPRQKKESPGSEGLERFEVWAEKLESQPALLLLQGSYVSLTSAHMQSQESPEAIKRSCNEDGRQLPQLLQGQHQSASSRAR